MGEKEYHTLFDTGPDGAALARNLDSLKVDIGSVDRIVLSHWHRDHSGGILEFLRRRRGLSGKSQITVDLHPSRPFARGIAPPPTFDKVLACLPDDPTFQEIEALDAIVDRRDEGHVVQGDTVYVSGEIPRLTEWERGLLGGVRWIPKEEAGDDDVKGKWISEPEILDERYAAVDVAGKGLVVFSSCSHAGICNVVSDASKRFQRPIYAVVGGLHLAGPELAPRIVPTVDYLKNKVNPPPTYVLPLHCTGLAAKVALVNAFGDGCVAAGVGMRARIDADSISATKSN